MLENKPFQLVQATPFIYHVKQQNPLVHCITNDVVQNFTANVLLAIGASPAMVIAKQEVESFITIADSLLINIGTIHSSTAKSMLLATIQALQTQTPWVLDPVAVGGALNYRTEIVCQLLSLKPTVIRGNASEILVLNGENGSSKGPDGQNSTTSAVHAAKALAQKYQTIVAMTGDIDYITNGNILYSITGGDIALTKVTGTGCALSAMVAAFIANSSDPLSATASACFMMKKAGQLANKQQGLGTFAVSLLDQLSLFNSLHQ
ncbi:hydroxyethylthiazole kinase [Gilliamella sp. Nev5-1]|uniref:hydroxyethylthiazole kinase n=1 Tax=unclassified Gilliamella TaxID=2685620 RepID=UPI00080E2FE0|nr:hydroxyethylthiazole kinase [Gilliamella apicola]OCG58493.1 hydroxyethylthiazole kinase [Gilliamella apicola]OCG60106.1 hydroxyethylthiazole kinase [Gilliamella apicola]OCG60641.1 hydroxyethylthiazole kinase [Gilliamella apicola]OCG61132.1 hydroxyethylthiazole kinase [Gilliamella apicola]OCG69009.1 hydroxyethylthiazole kinase [Gilliamella apicola]